MHMYKEKRKRALRIISKQESELFKASFRNSKLQKWIHPKRRSGRLRMNWTEETVQDIWQYIKKNDERYKYIPFDYEHEEIISIIKQKAVLEKPTQLPHAEPL